MKKTWFNNFQENERMQPHELEAEARKAMAYRAANEAAAPQPPRVGPDPEIEAIAAVYKHLAALTPEERTRVLAYIEARFAK